MRDNIEMRVEGLGGEFAKEFAITWSVRSKPRPVSELAVYLKKIMCAEKKMAIPKKPPSSLPTRWHTPNIGTLTAEVKELGAKYFSEITKFEEGTEKLRKEMEAKGEGSMYAMLQPDIRPTPLELVRDYEGRLDVLVSFVVPNGTALRWCQGKIKTVLRNEMSEDRKKHPEVTIQWDGMPDVTGWEK